MNMRESFLYSSAPLASIERARTVVTTVTLCGTLALAHGCALGVVPGDAGDASHDTRITPRDVQSRSDTGGGEDAGSNDAGGSDVVIPRSDAGGPVVADASMFPAYLHSGRTYDQERDYIAWEGPVEMVTIQHRDNTSLPPSEGGTSCTSTCTESITRINAGGRVRGRFTYAATFRAQVAMGGDPGLGRAVIEACGMTIAEQNLAGSGTLGFNNYPAAGPWPVPTAGDCEWSVRAVGGWVPFRAVDLTYRGGPAPTVDVRVNGTNGPLTVDAPASYLISWTSTSAASCHAEGDWSGARDIMGSVNFTGIPARSDTMPYTYRVVCTNGSGMASDQVQVMVARPPG